MKLTAILPELPMPSYRSLRFVLLSFLLHFIGAMAIFSFTHANELNLPELGNSVTSIVSPQQEHDIGQVFLRLYRSRVPEYDDTLLTDYLEKLLARIARSSKLEDKHLDLIVVSSPQINAFAAPGGIVGANSGLFLHTQSESELASVLSHELAHLSQHHYARSVEKSKQSTLPTLAGLLAGLILMGTGAGDAGMAAIASTQAANLQSSMRFSRQNEQEADNIGLQTLETAGFDPAAMTRMFEHMLDTQFTGQRPPEFLLSHPVTEKRIAESRARLTNLTVKSHYEDSLEFQLIRVRVQLSYAESPQAAVKRFQSEIDGKSLNVIASRYGLALAQLKARQYEDAEKNIRSLMKEDPQQNTFAMTLANLYLDREQSANALATINTVLHNDPTHYPARMLQAKILKQDKKFTEAAQVLYRLSHDRPNDAQVWYELAETSGQAGNIPDVHLARAEFFILNGVYDKARQQLVFAQKLLSNNYVVTERIKQRLMDIDKQEKMSLSI